MSSLIFLAFNKDPHLVIYVPVCLYLTLLYGWVYQYIDIKLCHSCYILAKMEPSDFGLTVLWNSLVHRYGARAKNHGVINLNYITHVLTRSDKGRFYKTL